MYKYTLSIVFEPYSLKALAIKSTVRRTVASLSKTAGPFTISNRAPAFSNGISLEIKDRVSKHCCMSCSSSGIRAFPHLGFDALRSPDRPGYPISPPDHIGHRRILAVDIPSRMDHRNTPNDG
jgi:hypothetical protein